MQFTYTFQLARYQAAIAALRQVVISPQDLLASLGESLLRVNAQRHRSGLAPDGTPWTPLAPMTIGSRVWQKQGQSLRARGVMSLAVAAKVNKSSRLLYGYGDMLGSFNYQVNGHGLRLGFSDRKAVWHHFGTGIYGPKGAPYVISPVKAKALAFAGLVRKRVQHPGLPRRELIGFPESDQRLAGKVAADHFRLALRAARKVRSNSA